MTQKMKMDALVPDFESLLSFSLSNAGTNMNSAARQMLDPVLSTLRAIEHNPKILNRAMLDYISLIQSDEATKSREELESRCMILATKHFNLVFASRVVNALPEVHDVTIRSLPVELLTHIFIIAKGLRSWLPNTQFRRVCRLWRDVYDDTPSLWNSVTLSRPVKNFDQLRRVLNRSKNHPLELFVASSSMSDQLFSILSSEMARVQDLSLDCSAWMVERHPTLSEEEQRAESDHMEKLTSRLAGISAPLLENLAIENVGQIPADVSPPATFPRLRAISVQCCDESLPFTSYIFKSATLTSLTLNQCAVGDSVDDMLLLLKTLPNLERFEVEDNYESFNLPFQFTNFEHKSISLPKLVYLDLNFELEIIAHVILILDFPISTRLVVRGLFEDQIHSPEFTQLLNVLDTAFRPHFQRLFPSATSGYGAMTITKHAEVDDEYLGFSIVMSWPESSPKCPHRFDFCAKGYAGYQEEYMEILMKVLSWPGMARTVTDICVDHTKFLRTQPEWQRLVGCFHALETIGVEGVQAITFFRILYKGLLPSSVTALRTIHVTQANAKAVRLIIRTLDKRVRTGQPKLTLELNESDIEPSELTLLELHEGIQEVTWDGKKAYHGPFDQHDGENHDDEIDDSEADETETL